ncbi:MAG TPA: hypothetical protein VD931_02555 [Baekduia sp.]|nr:hypothetical protein [Baekduia sp.]
MLKQLIRQVTRGGAQAQRGGFLTRTGGARRGGRRSAGAGGTGATLGAAVERYLRRRH